MTPPAVSLPPVTTRPALAAALPVAALVVLAGCGSGPPPVSASGSSASSPVPSLAVSGSAPAGSGGSPEATPANDGQVKITKCAADYMGEVTVEGYVTNTTGRRVQNLNVVFEIVDAAGTRLDTVFGSVDLLAAGQRARFYTNASTPITGKFTCRLLQVAAG